VQATWPTRSLHALQAKTIVFVSTCKQVRFLFEALRKLRPGVPLRALHGKMNQFKRMGGESGGRGIGEAAWRIATLLVPQSGTRWERSICPRPQRWFPV
jgi:hypothetical protein